MSRVIKILLKVLAFAIAMSTVAKDDYISQDVAIVVFFVIYNIFEYLYDKHISGRFGD